MHSQWFQTETLGPPRAEKYSTHSQFELDTLKSRRTCVIPHPSTLFEIPCDTRMRTKEVSPSRNAFYSDEIWRRGGEFLASHQKTGDETFSEAHKLNHKARLARSVRLRGLQSGFPCNLKRPFVHEKSKDPQPPAIHKYSKYFCAF